MNKIPIVDGKPKSDAILKGIMPSRQILIDDEPIPIWYPECPHSPDGFAWGYGGSGPAQAAYAILRTVAGAVLDDPDDAKAIAVEFYQEFKFVHIALLPFDTNWSIPLQTVINWMTTKIIDRGKRFEREHVIPKS